MTLLRLQHSPESLVAARGLAFCRRRGKPFSQGSALCLCFLSVRYSLLFDGGFFISPRHVCFNNRANILTCIQVKQRAVSVELHLTYIYRSSAPLSSSVSQNEVFLSGPFLLRKGHNISSCACSYNRPFDIPAERRSVWWSAASIVLNCQGWVLQ